MWRPHWWNRRWGEARRDLYLWDRPTWAVEARLGGVQCVSNVYPTEDEAGALAVAEHLRAGGGDWVELSFPTTPMKEKDSWEP